MFYPELQKLLKPIYDLTRKEKPFYWRKEQQASFEEIKCRLIKLLVFHMANKTGRFHLYFDTSKFTTGSALYQIQSGKCKLGKLGIISLKLFLWYYPIIFKFAIINGYLVLVLQYSSTQVLEYSSTKPKLKYLSC